MIVNMSALAGHWRASLAGVQYVAAKAGMEGLIRQLAYDWGKSGIRVNAIAPTVPALNRNGFGGILFPQIGPADIIMGKKIGAGVLQDNFPEFQHISIAGNR